MKQMIRIAYLGLNGFRDKNMELKKFFFSMRKGFYGFLSVLSIIFVIRLILFIGGNSKIIDFYDLLLAGVGFVLMTLESLIKKFY